MTNINNEKMVSDIALSIFRLVWWNFIDPNKRQSFHNDLLMTMSDSIVSSFSEQSGLPVTSHQRELLSEIVGAIATEIVDTLTTSPITFDEETFERFADNLIAQKRTSKIHEIVAHQYDVWTARIANLSDSLVGSLRSINEEYILWLKTHPDKLDTIHWHAFEKLTAEILASHGFTVFLTGQSKNKSADILAIDSNELGVTTKYLIECKRYKKTNKVNLNVINAVIGAKVRANVDHALLVTTSAFTRNVLAEEAKLVDYRLHLRDGEKVRHWLSNYQFGPNGLWLPSGWCLDR